MTATPYAVPQSCGVLKASHHGNAAQQQHVVHLQWQPGHRLLSNPAWVTSASHHHIVNTPGHAVLANGPTGLQGALRVLLKCCCCCCWLLRVCQSCTCLTFRTSRCHITHPAARCHLLYVGSALPWRHLGDLQPGQDAQHHGLTASQVWQQQWPHSRTQTPSANDRWNPGQPFTPCLAAPRQVLLTGGCCEGWSVLTRSRPTAS